MGTYSKVILGCVLLLVQAFSGASAQERMMDTLRLKICFERTSATINPDYKGNEARIRAFKEELQRVSSAPGCSVSSVEICAGASPDGNTRSNQELSEARTRSLLNYFYTHLRPTTLSCKDLPSAAINATSLGEYWKGLAVALQPVREPWASQALDIVRNTPVWVLDDKGVVVDSRKNQLKMLASGVAWGYMDQHLFDEYCSVGEISIALSSSFVGTPVGEDSTLVSAALPPAGVAYKRFAQESDTLLIRFKLDSTRVDQGFDDNRERIIAFQKAFERRYAGRPKNTIQLDIYAGASPEGTAAHNRWLGANRGAAIRRLVKDTLGLNVGSIYVHNLAARWDDFYDAVAASNEPWRDEVLRIIRMTPSEDENAWDHRERKLRAMQGGSVWPDLLQGYLAPLRSGGSAIISYHPERDTVYCGKAARDTVLIKDTLVIVHNYPVVSVAVSKERREVEPLPAWAIKTNLLFAAALAPNIQVEYPLGWNNRWSLEAEFIFPWWTFSHNAYAEQLLNLGLECRLWLGNRKHHHWLDGLHIGLGAGFGYYDFEWRSKGYQGEFVNAFLNLGYQHRWGRRKQWGIDAGIGLGLIYTPRIRRYLGSTLYPENHTEQYDDHLMYQNKLDFLWPGATHINVTIMYLFEIKRHSK